MAFTGYSVIYRLTSLSSLHIIDALPIKTADKTPSQLATPWFSSTGVLAAASRRKNS